MLDQSGYLRQLESLPVLTELLPLLIWIYIAFHMSIVKCWSTTFSLKRFEPYQISFWVILTFHKWLSLSSRFLGQWLLNEAKLKWRSNSANAICAFFSGKLFMLYADFRLCFCIYLGIRCAWFSDNRLWMATIFG